MAQIERQQNVLNILQNLRDLNGLKKLFWEELNYERENKPLSMRGWPDSALAAKAADPAADTLVLEGEIDRMVFELYGLTEEEIAIVEGSGK
ncbi:MAG: hypothetical protein NTV04_23850 [Deltaproteobacteria bacterium]|nr:hypothetical protein [Deltaproteobacteria bacterium]